MFLIFYGIFRLIAEFFREPDPHIGYLFNLLSMGAVLSLFMILIGFAMMIFLQKKMKINPKFLKGIKHYVDKFFRNVLYDNKFGYYNKYFPFGIKGDFITAPKISSLFSEMIAIWIISSWELFGKPKFLMLSSLVREMAV